jgi:hypothetical protein
MKRKHRRIEMKKLLISIVMVAVVVIALGTAGFVYAQTPTQTPQPGTGYGNGMMGGRGGMVGAQAAGTQDGLMHDEMIAAYAQGLEITVEDLNTRLANGETMSQIAASRGLSVEEFTTLMADARSQAIDQSVTNASLTQTQAEWLKQRAAGQRMGGGRGMRGTGQGQ